MSASYLLVDELSTPPLRTRISSLLENADGVDFAVRRIRLAALDLTERELAGTGRWRVLVSQLEAAMLLDLPGPRPKHLRRLTAFARSGRLQVRSVGLGAWSPDFAVLKGAGSGETSMIGSIYFGSPQLVAGPALTLISTAPEAARQLGRRFEELWDAGHDVLPAVLRVLARFDADLLAAPG